MAKNDNKSQAKASAGNSAEAKATVAVETAVQSKFDTALAGPYLDKSIDELIAIIVDKDQLIENLQGYLKGLEENTDRLKDRVERQDQRIDKALSLIKIGNRKFRALKIMAKVVGRIVIFGEELKRVKKGAVLFSSLSEDEQQKIFHSAPHLFEEVNS